MNKQLIARTTQWASAGILVVAAAGGAVLLLAGGSNSHTQQSQQPQANSQQREAGGYGQTVRVKAIRPKREHLKVTITEPAHVEPYEKADLYAKVSGYLRKVHADIGDRVEKDQVLAELWIPEMEQEKIQKAALVEKAQAEIGQAEAALKAAQSLAGAVKAKLDEVTSQLAKYEHEVQYRKGEYERYLGLFKERAVQRDVVDKELNQFRVAEASLTAAKNAQLAAKANVEVEQAKLIQAKADKESARARFKVAEADLKYTEIMVDYGKIPAPYDGIITQRFFHPGAFIQSAATGKAEPLFNIAGVDRLRIVTAVRETHSPSIRVGQPALLKVDAVRGQQFSGKVARLADALDRQSRTMLVEVELDQPAHALRPGMYGSVTITLADYSDAVTLPTHILAAGVRPSVYCVENGRACRREIELGYNDGVRMQVIQGLSADAEVISDGKGSVREGQAVELVN